MSVQIPVELIEKIRGARHVVAVTGAGVSAESGIPTFRDAQQGLWAQFRPEELASEAGFRAAPDRVWQWYDWRRSQILNVQPNAGHHALARLQRLVRLTLVTQNVDGLHQKAGSEDVVELHGSIHRVKCLDQDCGERSWPTEASGQAPRHECGSLLRPAVVWFGEFLPAQAIERAMAVAHSCDLLLSIGTSSMVYPAAELPMLAKRAGAVIVEINPNATPLSALADYVLNGAAGHVLPELVKALEASS